MPKPPKTVFIAKKEIGQRLRAIRQQRDMSQAELAETLGVTQPTVSAVEIGRRGLTVQQLVRLARALHVSPDEILGESNAGDEKRPKAGKLLRRLRFAERLPAADQRALLGHLDALLKSRGISTSDHADQN